MYFLNQRTGAIYKQSNEGEKKTFSINWFYIGEDNRLYYHPTYCLIQKILRSCCNAAQATGHFRHIKQKFIEMSKYDIQGVKPFKHDGLLPVVNQKAIEISQKDSQKVLKLLPIMDEDADVVVHFLKGGVIRMTGTIHRSVSDLQKMNQEELQETPPALIDQLPRLHRSLSNLNEKSFTEKSVGSEVVQGDEGSAQPKVIQLNENQHYVGEMIEGVPHGGGKEVLLVDGLSFSGAFRRGKKHGRGYITNSSLDTLYCEFIDDQICGI